MCKKYILLILCSILLAACSKPRFTLEFELPAALHSAYNISYYAASPKQGRWVETALMVQQGKGKMVLPLEEATVISLTAAGSTIHLYAEPGDRITISGESADPFSWKIGGNGINTQWSGWRNENSAAVSGHDSAKINAAVRKYIKKNPSEPLSALLLLYEYDRREDNEGFLDLWKSLKGEAAMEKWITLSGRTDLYTNKPLKPVKKGEIHRLVLKSVENGADTVVTGKVPVALYFWRTKDEGRQEMIDSLKNLRKAHPDSSSFIIADICLDADSLSWTSSIARDSLKHTVRAWNPIGEADSTLRALGVERTPFFLLIEK